MKDKMKLSLTPKLMIFWVSSPVECWNTFSAGFFLKISPCVWLNSGFWCCAFLTLRITLVNKKYSLVNNLWPNLKRKCIKYSTSSAELGRLLWYLYISMHLFALVHKKPNWWNKQQEIMDGKQKCTRETDRTKKGINQKAITPFSFLFIMKESWGRCMYTCVLKCRSQVWKCQ